MKKLLIAFYLLLPSVATYAQTTPTVTLTVNKTVADGKHVPVLTWTSSPMGPTSCTASGGWSGTKAGAGTQTLAEITASASYTLNCSWASTAGTATVTWTAPTLNTDGSALTNLAGFDVVAGTDPAALAQTTNVPGATVTSKAITGLASGTWYFGVLAYNTNGARSAISNVTSKVVNVGTPTASATATVTIRPVPAPPVLTTVLISWVQATPVFRVNADGRSIRTRVLGFVPKGRTCGAYVATWNGSRFHRVAVKPNELWPASTTVSTENLAAPCA